MATRCGGSPARRRALPAAVAVLLGLLAAPGPAAAEEVFTSQAAAANATASTWIPAPANPAAVCIVDTGVDPNPDTTNVIARFSVDGGDPGDVDTIGHHGTLMAMIASAPYNGWGMVGAAPSVKVVSVRAKRPGESGFYFSDVLKALQVCGKYRDNFNLKVISLSLGGQSDLDTDTRELLKETVDASRALGMNVVAAAGNRPGPADWPASSPTVLSVAASDKDGTRCGFSASGPAVDLSAPGCPQDVALADGRPAWASGTSESTALVAGVLAELRGLRPDLTVEQGEDLVTSAAAALGAGRVLDVAATFRAAGLHDALESGAATQPWWTSGDHQAQFSGAEAPAALGSAIVVDETPVMPHGGEGDRVSPVSQALQPTDGTLPRPRLRRRSLRNGVLQITLANRPATAQTRVVTYSRRMKAAFPSPTRSLLATGDRIRTRVFGKVSEVSITYVDPGAKWRRSVALTIRY